MISQLKKQRAKRVMGIDCSTKSLAFAVMYNRKLIRWGKVNFAGSDFWERLSDATDKIRALKEEFDVDYIVFESAILAKTANADVTIKLAMVYGAVIAELRRSHTNVVTVKPLEWQSFIDNPNFKKAEKDKVKAEFPGKSAAWYSTKIRELRKQKTMDFFNKKWPQMNLTDDDVGDACGIAYFGYYNLTRR